MLQCKLNGNQLETVVQSNSSSHKEHAHILVDHVASSFSQLAIYPWPSSLFTKTPGTKTELPIYLDHAVHAPLDNESRILNVAFSLPLGCHWGAHLHTFFILQVQPVLILIHSPTSWQARQSMASMIHKYYWHLAIKAFFTYSLRYWLQLRHMYIIAIVPVIYQPNDSHQANNTITASMQFCPAHF